MRRSWSAGWLNAWKAFGPPRAEGPIATPTVCPGFALDNRHEDGASFSLFDGSDVIGPESRAAVASPGKAAGGVTGTARSGDVLAGYAPPLWVVGLLFLSALTIAVALGYAGQTRLQRMADAGSEPPPGGAHLLSAVLGLLALLLGFSFSMAMDRYDTRRQLVVQEANALGTTWLRIQLLDEPDRTVMSDLMRRYVDARLTWSNSTAENPPEAGALALQQQLWAATGVALRSDSPPLLTRGVMDSLNESIDLAAARAAARAAHIPDFVQWLLLVYAILAMAMLGTVLGSSLKQHLPQTALLLVLLTLSHMIVLDLDRPRSGSIQVSQQPMEDLRQSID
jgi:hypothetical protein